MKNTINILIGIATTIVGIFVVFLLGRLTYLIVYGSQCDLVPLNSWEEFFMTILWGIVGFSSLIVVSCFGVIFWMIADLFSP